MRAGIFITALTFAIVVGKVFAQGDSFQVRGDSVVLEEETFSRVWFSGEEPLDEIVLHGLAQRYPDRLTQTPPPNPENGQKRSPAVEELPRGIAYARVYQLPALGEIPDAAWQTPALILDFRFLESGPDTKASADLLAMLGLEPGEANYPQGVALPDEDAVQRRSDGAHPAVVLVNSSTTGPVEAALDALQRAGRILAIGLPTAGRTGRYRELAAHPGWYVIEAESKVPGHSLLGEGMEPEIVVGVTPEDDYRGFFVYEKGGALSAMVDFVAGSVDPEDGADKAPTDPILQRAVQVILALQALGELPREKVDTQ